MLFDVWDFECTAPVLFNESFRWNLSGVEDENDNRTIDRLMDSDNITYSLNKHHAILIRFTPLIRFISL